MLPGGKLNFPKLRNAILAYSGRKICFITDAVNTTFKGVYWND